MRAKSASRSAALQGVLALVLLTAGATALAYTESQANNGRLLYLDHCAACHGRDLRGGPVPAQFSEHAGDHAFALAGPDRLPGLFSAMQVLAYARTAMPQQQPDSLTTEEYLELTAFLVKVNGLAAPNGAPVTTEELTKISVPHPAR
ncbi:MAG TPA: hypothetical protein DFS52_00310 [Myxococcales bacterium]|nr:hypothetical protein [Myxococcales bacterium]